MYGIREGRALRLREGLRARRLNADGLALLLLFVLWRVSVLCDTAAAAYGVRPGGRLAVAVPLFGAVVHATVRGALRAQRQRRLLQRIYALLLAGTLYFWAQLPAPHGGQLLLGGARKIPDMVMVTYKFDLRRANESTLTAKERALAHNPGLAV